MRQRIREGYIICLHKLVNYVTCNKYTDKKKKQKNEHNGIARRIISSNNADPEFIKTISCICDSY